MKDVKYLKDNGLYDAHLHFMRLTESYYPIEDVMSEDGEDGQDPMADPMAGGAQEPESEQGTDPMGGQGTDPMGDVAQDPMAGADPMGAGLDSGNGEEAMGGAPMDGQGQETSGNEEGDGETIDIDGLTKAEEKLNVKQNQIGRDLAKVDSRLTNLMKALDAFEDAVQRNNEKIEDLRTEFEKRNPTQTEKLNLRSLDSYPFNISPADYWRDKESTSNYSAYGDNQEPTTKEYVITNNDVDDINDDIANTFFDVDEDDVQTFDKIFNHMA